MLELSAHMPCTMTIGRLPTLPAVGPECLQKDFKTLCQAILKPGTEAKDASSSKNPGFRILRKIQWGWHELKHASFGSEGIADPRDQQ